MSSLGWDSSLWKSGLVLPKVGLQVPVTKEDTKYLEPIAVTQSKFTVAKNLAANAVPTGTILSSATLSSNWPINYPLPYYLYSSGLKNVLSAPCP